MFREVQSWKAEAAADLQNVFPGSRRKMLSKPRPTLKIFWWKNTFVYR